MSMVKRAFLYLQRKKVRTALLFLLLFVLSLSLTVGVTVWGSVGAATEEVQDRLGTSFVVKMNPGLTGPFETVRLKSGGTQDVCCGPRADRRLIEAIMGIEGIAAYNAEAYQIVYAEDFAPVAGGWSIAADEYKQTMEANPEMVENQPEGELDLEDYQLWGHTLMAYANSDTALYSSFRTGAFLLTDGRHIQPDDTHKVMLSEELAERNGLQVGDFITIGQRRGMFDGSARDDKMDSLGAIELEIVGIFHVNGYQPINRFTKENDIIYNQIMIDLNTCEEFGTWYYIDRYEDYVSDFYFSNIVFFVDEPERLTEIVDAVGNLDSMNPDVFSITEDDTMYRSTVEPLDSGRNLVTAAMAAVAAGCVVVLLIVSTMWIRSRRKEVAIYLSLGFRKRSILGQFMVETVLVAFVAFVAAAAVSQPVAAAAGSRIAASAVEQAAPEMQEYSEDEIMQAARSGRTSELFTYDSGTYAGPEHIDFGLTAGGILVLLAIELLVIAGAVCKGGSFVFALPPRQILTTLS